MLGEEDAKSEMTRGRWLCLVTKDKKGFHQIIGTVPSTKKLYKKK